MKNLTKVITLAACVLCLSGCGNEQMHTPSTDAIANLDIEMIGTFEWVSPDGVHYWVYNGGYAYGVAPRYDSNGELVISGK